MARLWATIVLAGLLVLFLTQAYSFWGRRSEAQARYDEVRGYLNKAQADNLKLRSDLNYFSDPSNLEKEIRSKFNYKNPGEQAFILISTSTQQ